MQARQLEKAPVAKVSPQKISRVESAPAARVSRAAPVLLQLQKKYGNRYVQAAVARARQGSGETEAPSEVGERIESQRGLGQSLDRGVRTQMESAFGTSFQHVRVHTGAEADQLNRAVNARAFTTGRDIFFRTGEYSPHSYGGRELLAHELTHVVQQTGTVQPKLLISHPNDRYEQEADRVARTVMQAQSSPRHVEARSTTLARMQHRIQRWSLRGAWNAVTDTVSSAVSAVGDVVGNVIDRAVSYIRDHARSIPGYDLVAVILGRDPITQQPVERNATNLLRGLLGLIPGGAQIFENLQRSGVIQRAFDWVSGELGRLNLTWPVIRGAIQRFLSSLSPGDIFHLGDVFERVRAIFGPMVSNLISFARAAGSRILEFIFEGAMALGGSAAQRILGIFRRIGASFSLIVNDPVRFLQNLIGAVGGAFRNFGANILTHLRTAVFDWLFGALQGAGLQLPQRFDLRGIVSIILQILGLTYARLRARMVRVIGERPVQILEGAFEFLQVLVTQGLAAAWQKILEYAENLTDTVIEGIKSWIRNTIVTQAIQQIASLLTPVGAIIQAIIKIYNTVMFVIERAQQLAAFVGSVIESVENIARGNVSSAIAYVERTLARILPLVISFLARFIGLGGIGNRIREIIQRIQGVVDRAFDRVIDWIATTARRIWSGVTSTVGGAAQRVMNWLGIRKRIQLRNREQHTLYFQQQGSRSVIMLASNPIQFRAFISSIRSTPRVDNDKQIAITLVNEIDRQVEDTRTNNVDHTAKITEDMENLGRITVELMSNALRGDVRTTPPVYAGLQHGFGKGMRVMLVTHEIVPGSSPNPGGENPIFDRLNLRRKGNGSYYVLGHLLSEKLGGLGTTWDNLTPLSRSSNRNHEHKIESIIKPVVGTTPRAFLYVVTPVYSRTQNMSLINQINAPSAPGTQGQKAIRSSIVGAEQYVPTSLVCSIQEIDPLSGQQTGIGRETYTIENSITQSSPADYEI